MDLHLLRSFREVARERSFTAAAKNLLLTQPAVSQQVKALEKEVGERLLDRARPPRPRARVGAAARGAVRPGAAPAAPDGAGGARLARGALRRAGGSPGEAVGDASADRPRTARRGGRAPAGDGVGQPRGR